MTCLDYQFLPHRWPIKNVITLDTLPVVRRNDVQYIAQAWAVTHTFSQLKYQTTQARNL